MDKMQIQETISALADGQLQGAAFADAVELAAAERRTWQAYHVIGDVLRSGDLAAGSDPDGFMLRLRERLQAEASPTRPDVVTTLHVPLADVQRPAANDATRGWKLVAGLATVAAVAAVGWNVSGSMSTPAVQPQLAAAPATQPVAAVTPAERGAMIRDARLDEFLAAHRQFGGGKALQAPAGFLRNATFEAPSR